MHKKNSGMMHNLVVYIFINCFFKKMVFTCDVLMKW
jgi:hypothetical protein